MSVRGNCREAVSIPGTKVLCSSVEVSSPIRASTQQTKEPPGSDSLLHRKVDNRRMQQTISSVTPAAVAADAPDRGDTSASLRHHPLTSQLILDVIDLATRGQVQRGSYAQKPAWVRPTPWPDPVEQRLNSVLPPDIVWRQLRTCRCLSLNDSALDWDYGGGPLRLCSLLAREHVLSCANPPSLRPLARVPTARHRA